MLPLLSLHALAAQRGDGLRPELKALFERSAGLGMGLAAVIEPDEQESVSQVTDVADEAPAKKFEDDGATARVS